LATIGAGLSARGAQSGGFGRFFRGIFRCVLVVSAGGSFAITAAMPALATAASASTTAAMSALTATAALGEPATAASASSAVAATFVRVIVLGISIAHEPGSNP